MDQFDFDNIYSDQDFDFTLDDILSEFHSDKSLLDETEAQKSSGSGFHADNDSGKEFAGKGDSVIDYTNLNDKEMNAGTEEYSSSDLNMNSDHNDFHDIDSYITKTDPDIDMIISELIDDNSTTDDFSEEIINQHDDTAENHDVDHDEFISDDQERFVAEDTSDNTHIPTFEEDWKMIKESFSENYSLLKSRFSSLLNRNRSDSVISDDDQRSDVVEVTEENYYSGTISEESSEDLSDITLPSFSGDESSEKQTNLFSEDTPSEADIASSQTVEIDDNDPDSFSPELSTEEDALNAYASNIKPDDEFSEADPDDSESGMLSYYFHKIKSFFAGIIATIMSIIHGNAVENKDEDTSDDKKPSKIVQYLAALSLKIQQNQNSANSAPAREAEELGPELSSEKASKYYGSQIKFMKHRLRIAGILCVFLAYIAFGLPVPGRLNNTIVSSSACLALELSVIVCCLDIFTAGIMDLVRKRPNANTLVSISCLLSIIDAIIISMGGNNGVGLPYCAISAITITCTLWASLLYCRGNRITLRTLALSKNPYAITAEPDIGGYTDLTLLKTKTSTDNFVRRTEEKALDDEIYTILAPWLIGISLLFALIAALIGKTWSSFFHIWSAIFIPAAPFCILLSFPLPFLYTAKSLFHNGTAIAGWSGLCDIGESKHIVVKDDDVFPKNTISIDSIRILEGVDPQKIITYTGSVIIASGSALSPAFSELMNKNSCVIEQVSEFKCHEGGGLTAMINGDEVLCGNSGFMHLMGIHIPQKLASKSSVFVAVNGVISAIYAIKYTPVVSVQKALITLLRSRRTSIFAVKDFNITPEMIRHKFKMPSDRFDFPSFADRYAIAGAKRGKESKIAAVVARDGIGSMVQLQDEGHRLYSTIRLSVLISVLCTVIGMILVFILSLSGSLDSISVGNLLLYMIIWLVIQIAVVALQNR